jgi:hypothetical protein
MISGRQALERIEAAVTQLRQDESHLDAALRAASDTAARLRRERMDGFRALARLRLDALQREAVVGELEAVERRALALLAQGRKALDELSGKRQQAQDAVRQAEAERHRRSEALEAAVAAVATLRASVEAAAREGATLTAQRARLDAAAAVAGEAEKKAAQAEADRAEKGRPYEADPLFMYLWGKKFGTAEDRSGRFVRFFDAGVARLVGYAKARANYAMLNEIPRRLAEHAARMKAEIAAERATLTRVERQELVKAGIEPLERAAVDARAALDTAERTLAAAKKILKSFDLDHQAAAEGGAYGEAVELLAKADARQDLRELYREALKTPTTADEAIVKTIEATEAQIGRAEKDIGATRRKLKELAERRAGLERERDAFRREGYDSPWGEFGNDQALAQVLGGILGGVISSTVLRDTLRGGYRRGGTPWDPGFGGGGGFPLPAPPPDGGGSSSDSSSSGSSPWADITEGLWGGSGSSLSGSSSSDDGFATGGTLSGDGGGGDSFRTGGSF